MEKSLSFTEGDPFAWLLAPTTPEAFVREHWGQAPLLVRGAPNKFTGLMSHARFGELVHGDCAPEISCTFPDYDRSGIAALGTHPITTLRPDQVDMMLAAGATVTLQRLERMEPTLAALTAAIKARIAYVGDIHARCWLSPKNGGLPVHFDGTSTITMQVQGRKVWRVSAHPVLAWPDSFGVPGPDGRVRYFDEDATSLQDWELNIPAVDEGALTEYLLEPGDLLFIPAGTWHETRAVDCEASLAINLAFGAVRVLDFVVDALRQRLAERASWRHVPLVSRRLDGAFAPEVRDFLRERLDELGDEIAVLARDERLHAAWKRKIATVGAPPVRGRRAFAPRQSPPEVTECAMLTFATAAPVTYVEGHGPDGAPVVQVFHGAKDVTFDQPEHLAFARRLAQTRMFRAADARHWADASVGYAWHELKDLLDALVQADVLRVVKGP